MERPPNHLSETQLLEQRKQHVRAAFERGLENEDRDIVAYHGTSIETIIEALRTGYFIGTTMGGAAREVTAGRSEPVFSVFSLQSPQDRLSSHASDEDFDAHLASEAKRYAEVLGEHHYFLRCLHIPISKRYELPHRLYELVSGPLENADFCEDMCRAFAETVGVSVAEVKNAIRKASKRKGVVIGFSKEIFDRFSYKYVSRASRDEDHEAVIACPDGIPMEYMLGLDAQSKQEWAELEQMIE